MNHFLTPYDIVKIKVFSRVGEIIYSTDHALIGEKNPDNRRLQIALSGLSSSTKQLKGEISDLRGEKHFDVDLVETYIPIKNAQGMVEGSFEIYQNVTQSSLESRHGVLESLFTLGTILALSFSLSFLVVRKATKELAQAQQLLHTMATLDPLTGLYNRGMITGAAEEETARTLRRRFAEESPPFSLVMIDIDKFKDINDKYGHPVGDMVIQEVAASIRSSLRGYDRAGRYGGEEFLVLLPDTNLDGATLLAERVRIAVEQLRIVSNEQSIAVTASFGVASILPDELDYQGALKRADEGLYIAKNEGRNRVGCTTSMLRASEMTPHADVVEKPFTRQG